MNRVYGHNGYEDDPHTLPSVSDELADPKGPGTFIPEHRIAAADYIVKKVVNYGDLIGEIPSQTFHDSFPRGYED